MNTIQTQSSIGQSGTQIRLEPRKDNDPVNVARQWEIMRNLNSGFIDKRAAQAECTLLAHRYITDTSTVPHTKFCMFCGAKG